MGVQTNNSPNWWSHRWRSERSSKKTPKRRKRGKVEQIRAVHCQIGFIWLFPCASIVRKPNEKKSQLQQQTRETVRIRCQWVLYYSKYPRSILKVALNRCEYKSTVKLKLNLGCEHWTDRRELAPQHVTQRFFFFRCFFALVSDKISINDQ